MKLAKNTVCLWCSSDAEGAVAFCLQTDRYWHAIVGNGGTETEAVTDPDRPAAKRAFDAMMTMGEIDIAAIEAARRGETPNADC